MDAEERRQAAPSGTETARDSQLSDTPSHERAYATPPVRWFAEKGISAVVSSINAEIAYMDVDSQSRQASKAASKADETKSMARMAVLLAVVLVGMLLGVTLLGGQGDAEHQLTPGTLAGSLAFLVFIVLMAFFGFGRVFGVRENRVKGRHAALQDLAKRADSLSCGHSLQLRGDSVGTIPWLASEMDCVVECDLHGSHRGHRLALLRCSYVVDSTLTAIEDSLGGAMGQVASKVMSHIDHEKVTRHECEAIVFLDSVAALPDVFFSAKKQPLIWYFQRAFRDHELNAVSDDSHWLAASDAGRCRQTFNEDLLRLLKSRSDAVLQVIGGHVVAISQTWQSNKPEMAQDRDQIERNLDWACDVYEALGGTSGRADAPSPVVSASPVVAEIPQAAAIARTSLQHAQPRQRHWLVRALAGLVGFPILFLFGGITILFVMQCLAGAQDESLPAKIVSTFLSGGIALFGLWLASMCLSGRGRRESVAT